MTRIYLLLALALLTTQVLSAPTVKQNVGERKATNKEAANLEEELHKQAGEGKKDTPETSEPSPGHKPRGALGQLMEAAAEEEESAEEKGATTTTEDDAKLQNVIYSIYNNPEVLKALLRAGETKDTNKEVLPPKTPNGLKRNSDDDEDDEPLRSNIIKKDGDDLYEPMIASKKIMSDMPIMLQNKYGDVYGENEIFDEDGDVDDDKETGDYPGEPLTADEEAALEAMEDANGIKTDDEQSNESDDEEQEEDVDEDEEPDDESTTTKRSAQ